MTAVVVTAVFHPPPGQQEALGEALRTTMPGVHEEQGCRLYAIHDADDGTVTMIEKWDSAADLQAHSTSPAVEALRDGWRAKKFTMNEVVAAAEVCRVRRVIQPYLEMLT